MAKVFSVNEKIRKQLDRIQGEEDCTSGEVIEKALKKAGMWKKPKE